MGQDQLAERGEFGQGGERGEEAIEIAEQVKHPVTLIEVYWAVGSLNLRKGAIQQAISVLQRGVGVAEDANIVGWFPWVASPLGLAYALSGKIGEGVALLERAVQTAESIKILAYHSLAVAYLAEAKLLACQLDEAMSLSQRALEHSRARKERGVEARALHLLARIGARRDPSDAGCAHAYRRALALAEDLGMRPLAAHCRLGLGRLFRQMGQDREARTELENALDLYSKMDMLHWSEQAQIELEALNQSR